MKDKVTIDQAAVYIVCLYALHILKTRGTFSNICLRLDVDLFRKQILTASNLFKCVCFAKLFEVLWT